MNALREGDWHWANSYDSGSVQVLLLLPIMIIMIIMIKFPMMNFMMMVMNLISYNMSQDVGF